jgi:SUN domain-containing protein 1/2
MMRRMTSSRSRQASRSPNGFEQGKKALNIKASDSQDVTELIGHLVDTAMSRHSKDLITKADFALHSCGAVVIPSLTSDMHETRPQGE